ncbi:NADPH-dependent FMN reductase [Rahnella sp. GSA61A]|jgi:NAD(P)H-dependent FMN reductase|uniref:NADPH-dependent FMN reductase n=1 Tax=Rahnella sp. GSA61A TaxID=2862678 RepID=UPI001CC0FBD3|nr:NAD(P)H-dependent oxidoreductase [Rahnella sp. GSA61A]
MNIKIITGSVRKGRIGPQISEWICKAVGESQLPLHPETIDLTEWNLPMDDEAYLPATGNYEQPHTLLWSKKIAEGDMFVFVFPQYNWGYPAALKNAIDHLYNEWKEKPALIVTYANRGGGKAAAQLRQVIDGIHMINLSSGLEIKLSEITLDLEGQIEHPDMQLSKYLPDLMALLNEGYNEKEKLQQKYQE